MKGKNSISAAKREPRELCYYFAAEVANADSSSGAAEQSITVHLLAVLAYEASL